MVSPTQVLGVACNKKIIKFSQKKRNRVLGRAKKKKTPKRQSTPCPAWDDAVVLLLLTLLCCDLETRRT